MIFFLLIIILLSNLTVYTKCNENLGISSQTNNTHRSCTENDCRLLHNNIPSNETQDFLLFSVKKRIMRLNLTTKSIYELNIPNLTQVSSIDFDVNNQCVYWGGISNISRHCLNNDVSEFLLSESLKSVISIALNWMSHTLYFVNNGYSKIEVIRTDTVDKMRTTLLDNKILGSPVAIAVHPKAGYMFWTDWYTKNPSVNRAELDGTNIKKLFGTPRVKSPFGITVDYTAERIYWVDTALKYIASSELNGGLFKVILRNSKATHYPYAISIFKKRMYWTDWQYEVIFSADKEEGKKIEVPYRNVVEERPEDLKIFGNGTRVNTNACQNTNCRYICVEKPMGSNCLCPDDLVYVDQDCVCPRNVAPVVNLTCQQKRPSCLDDQFTCNNLLCVQKNQMCNGNNDCGDGSDEKNCADKSNDDFSQEMNYLNNSQQRYCTKNGCSLLPSDSTFNETQDFLLFCTKTSIMHLNLATKSLYKLNIMNLTKAFSIDFDMNTKCVYWAADTINRQCLHNNESEILLSVSFQSVEGIALDWNSHTLYFVNSNHSKIELIRIDTVDRMRTTLLDNKVLDKPRGIALHPKAGYMFWTDWSPKGPSVNRADLDGTNIKTLLDTKTKKLFEEPKVKYPNGITVDYITERIYWVDSGLHCIVSSDFNGGLLKTILPQSRFTKHSYAIGIFRNKMYWTDWKYEVLFSADKETGKEVEVLYQNILRERPIDLKIFGNGSRVDTTACDRTSCKYVCVETPTGISCLCPNDLIYQGEDCVCPGTVAPFFNLTCQQKRPMCLDDEFTCKNLLCVKKIKRCDGKNDCADGSDENCPKLVCKETTHSCGYPNDQCIPLSWVCDGDVDCTSGSDEKNCPTF